MSKAIFGLESGQITPIAQDHTLAIKHPAFPNDKIKKLGWTIKTSLYDGLIKTIDPTSYT